MRVPVGEVHRLACGVDARTWQDRKAKMFCIKERQRISEDTQLTVSWMSLPTDALEHPVGRVDARLDGPDARHGLEVVDERRARRPEVDGAAPVTQQEQHVEPDTGGRSQGEELLGEAMCT